MSTAETTSAALDIVMSRDSDYEPGSMSDGYKVGIAAETGGGAGAVSLGVIAKLHELGALDKVDVDVTLSVGSINMAAARAGQINIALKGYNDLADRRFFDWFRPLRVMDLGILDDTLRDPVNGIDTHAIANSPIPLKVGVTCLNDNFKPEIFDLTTLDPDDIVDVLMWGVTIPGLGGFRPPRDHKGIGPTRNAIYIDGGFSHMSAVDMAKNEDCSHIIYIPNYPYAPAKKYSKTQVFGSGAAMTPYNPLSILHLRKIVTEQIASRRDFCEGNFNYKGANVTAIYPPMPQTPEEALPGMTNMDKKRIEVGFDIAAISLRNCMPGFAPINPANA